MNKLTKTKVYGVVCNREAINPLVGFTNKIYLELATRKNILHKYGSYLKTPHSLHSRYLSAWTRQHHTQSKESHFYLQADLSQGSSNCSCYATRDLFFQVLKDWILLDCPCDKAQYGIIAVPPSPVSMRCGTGYLSCHDKSCHKKFDL